MNTNESFVHKQYAPLMIGEVFFGETTQKYENQKAISITPILSQNNKVGSYLFREDTQSELFTFSANHKEIKDHPQLHIRCSNPDVEGVSEVYTSTMDHFLDAFNTLNTYPV